MGVESIIKAYERKWIERCYEDGLPDEVPIELKDLAPSWKLVCLCILNNDLHFTKLGFSGFDSVYYHELKKIELRARPCKNGQLKLF